MSSAWDARTLLGSIAGAFCLATIVFWQGILDVLPGPESLLVAAACVFWMRVLVLLALRRSAVRRRAYALEAVVVVLVVAGFTATSRSREELIREGERLVAAVDGHRSRTGVLPETLAEAGARTGPTWYGSWKLRQLPGGYGLSLGDYRRDGFELYWDSSNREWNVNN